MDWVMECNINDIAPWIVPVLKSEAQNLIQRALPSNKLHTNDLHLVKKQKLVQKHDGASSILVSNTDRIINQLLTK